MHPHLVAFQVLNRQGLDVLAYNAGYNTAYVNAGMTNPVTGLPLEGYGPPLDYNGGLGCSATAPARGDARYMGPAPQCVLGGNPDPALSRALLGLPVPPMPQEIGWKDTVQALPNMVTRFLVRFGKPDLPADHRRRRPARLRLQPERRPRLRLALPHRGPRGQRDDAAVSPWTPETRRRSPARPT